jgi:hypothetical protein
MFSKYLHDNKIQDILLNNIEQFQKKHIMIDKNFKYGKVSKRFSMTGGIINREKIVVKSEEALKRLIYVLRINIMRQKEVILNYHKRTMIMGFYVDITDFDKISSQVILHGNTSVSKWIQEQKKKYLIYDNVIIGAILPYFFKNSLIENKVYLAQNTDTLLKAVHISKIWKTDGYNPGSDVKEIDALACTLYSYVNPTNITPYQLSGRSNDMNIKLLGYKVNGVNMYTALLEL